jgi:hypothetical protein
VERRTTGSTFAAIWTGLTLLVLAALTFDLIPHLGHLLNATPTAAAANEAARAISDCSRFLGVSLSMLVALCALAIPLTANVYTPKLIELFVTDRVNRAAIAYFVLANAIVLWNGVMVASVGHDISAAPRVLVSLGLTVVGLLIIPPYFLYVLRFLVPQSIVSRIKREVVASLDALEQEHASGEEQEAGIVRAVTSIQYLGKVTLRSVQRHDRDVASEGLRALEEVFRAYLARKGHLPQRALRPRSRDALGLSPELALEIERKQAVIEVAILQELQLILPVAISTEVSEVASQIASLTRHLGVRVADQGDEGATEMVTLYFNTFIRQALKAKSAEAFYKLVYQYRRFAEEILTHAPQLAERVAFFLDYYAHQAVRMGMPFLLNVVAYDLAGLCEEAFRRKVASRHRLLDIFLELDRDAPGILDMPGMVKAQIILAAKLATLDEAEAAARVEEELAKVSKEVLRETFGHIIAVREEHFWEIADRRRHLDHVESEYRPAVRGLRRRLVGESEPGIDTLLFMGEITSRERGLTARAQAPLDLGSDPQPALEGAPATPGE